MNIAIDSMIWIYNIDPNAPEHQNIKQWMRGKDGALQKYEQIVINTIIPLEILHSLSKNPTVDYTLAYNAVSSIIALNNVKIIDLDSRLMKDTFSTFGMYRNSGIGVRDASIITAMLDSGETILATHDKNLLSIRDFKRVDPVFSPPFILEIDEELDLTDFKEKMKEFSSKFNK